MQKESPVVSPNRLLQSGKEKLGKVGAIAALGATAFGLVGCDNANSHEQAPIQTYTINVAEGSGMGNNEIGMKLCNENGFEISTQAELQEIGHAVKRTGNVDYDKTGTVITGYENSVTSDDCERAEKVDG